MRFESANRELLLAGRWVYRAGGVAWALMRQGAAVTHLPHQNTKQELAQKTAGGCPATGRASPRRSSLASVSCSKFLIKRFLIQLTY
jgi:hypothetical protein